MSIELFHPRHDGAPVRWARYVNAHANTTSIGQVTRRAERRVVRFCGHAAPKFDFAVIGEGIEIIWELQVSRSFTIHSAVDPSTGKPA